MKIGKRLANARGSARLRCLALASRVFRGFLLRVERLRWGVVANGVYRPARRDAGFFSLCTTSLADLGLVGDRIDRIVAKRAFHQYRALPCVNSWAVFFQQPAKATDGGGADSYVSTLVKQNLHHGEYRSLDFDSLLPFIERYFAPSARVEARRREFEERYSLTPSDLIAVNIRGTDKWKEIPLASVERYLDLAERSAQSLPHAQILLVTDQQQFVRPFETRFGARLTVIRELPTSSLTDRPIHQLLKLREKENFGVDFLSVVLLMAAAKIVITHTGNTAFWTVLFRGNSNGLIQLRGDETFGELAS